MALYAGQGVSLAARTAPAAEIVREIAADARTRLRCAADAATSNESAEGPADTSASGQSSRVAAIT
jgi:hypothetical protein